VERPPESLHRLAEALIGVREHGSEILRIGCSLGERELHAEHRHELAVVVERVGDIR
jgi:hypothetical protein